MIWGTKLFPWWRTEVCQGRSEFMKFCCQTIGLWAGGGSIYMMFGLSAPLDKLDDQRKRWECKYDSDDGISFMFKTPVSSLCVRYYLVGSKGCPSR